MISSPFGSNSKNTTETMKIPCAVMMAVGAILSLVHIVKGFSSFSIAQSHKSVMTLTSTPSPTRLNFFGGGSGAKDLDEEWERQQELLRLRQASPEDRAKYFQSVEDRRVKATEEQIDKWAWQRKQYKKGEDPIDEWRKRRASGQISDLENQYGDPKKIGGIPLPSASFGVGGEFGVGGKFDNGGRFDLRLPYAEQGWVDEESDGNPFSNLFGGGKKKNATTKSGSDGKNAVPVKKEETKPKKNDFWPF